MRAGRLTTALVVVTSLVAACSSNGSPAKHSAVVAQPQALSGNELLYGASPRDDGKIVYQPDVVLLGGGANSVRSVSSDALVWTIDANAAGADQLTPGKVLFASSLGAGRVLGVEDDGPNKRIALGPIAITDLIKDGNIRSDQPVSVESFQVYSTPDAPGLQTDEESDAATTDPGTPSTTTTTEPTPVTNSAFRSRGGHRAVLAVARPAATPTLPKLQPPSPKPPSGGGKVGPWTTYSICCTVNGIHVTYDQGGARVQGTAEIKFTQPSVDFSLTISGGSLIEASAKLNGAASLSFGISAAITASSGNTRSGRVQLPFDIAIPIAIGGLPFNVSFQQLFTINLGLSGTASLSTEGEYALGGSLGFSVRNGVPSAETPTLTTVKSALDNIHSLAVAPQGLSFAYGLKTMIGVGPPGLSAGVWYQVSAALSMATSGAQLDPIQGTSLVTCKTVSLRLLGRYGVGYQIPSLVAKAINLFLSLVMKDPPAPVKPTGGKSWGPTVLFKKDTPPCSSSRGQG